MMKLGFWVGVLCLILPSAAAAEVVKGIYGVPSIGDRDPLSYVGDMEKAGVNAVFVKPDLETVRWFKGRGFKVFVSVDAYGGSKAWKRFPDSRPVLADGSLLGENREYACHGGACPSHEGWREEQLAYINGLIREYEAEGVPIDGIWLDYIRYPGRWSVLKPEIPDTCYCGRCLEKFSRETGISLPIGASRKDAKTQRGKEGRRSDVRGQMSEGCGRAVGDEKDGLIGWAAGTKAEEAANWIKRNCPYEWMKWKKRQIEAFVRDVRNILDNLPEDVRPILGIFLVPWTQGERGNAVCYDFGQDGFELAQYADVISPMVYHKRVGRPPSWVGFMTQYYEETVPCQVWPIVEAHSGPQITQISADGEAKREKDRAHGAEEFSEVMRYAGEGGAQGVLGYSFGAWRRAQSAKRIGEGFRGFGRLENLLGSADYADYRDEKIGSVD